MNLHASLARIEGAFAARLRKGITVNGITLRAADADRTAFAQLLTMLSEAERLGLLPPKATIADKSGTAHELPTAQLRAMLVQYGGIYQAIWLQKITLQNAVKSAPNDQARAAIHIHFD
jgi:hypothetical protein